MSDRITGELLHPIVKRNRHRAYVITLEKLLSVCSVRLRDPVNR